MSDSTVPFSVFCNMLEAVSKSRKLAVKRKHLSTFLDHVYMDRALYSVLRLILPILDKERPAYGLKEAVLAKCLSDSLGLSKDSPDFKRLHDWKKAGGNAGNFPLVAAEVLYRRQSTVSGNITIKDVNDDLDKLASCEGRNEKTAIISALIKKTSVREMTWLIRFILKELKLGISEKTVLSEFHPDAENLLNVSCDLKLVCEKLKDRNQRLAKQDIAVGVAVRPQLAMRATDVEEVWRKLRGKRIVAECKFDGDRIQVHKNGDEVHFFSRSFIDHKEYTEGLASILCKQIQIGRCILDGEMLVWNKHTNRFAEFGSNQSAAKAAKEGLESDQQLCYVAFDILYANDGSVTHQALQERHRLLKQVVNPVKGSLELLLPGHGACLDKDQPPWSLLVQSPEEINKFFLQTVENREEGIVLKDYDSKWEPGDRSSKWMKLKPDYVHAESDIDALIIGCFVGSGRRGGEIGQFLLGLAEKPKEGGYPTKFLSFCRVGSGLSDNERDLLISKLKPYLRPNNKNTKPPSFYILTNAGKERPDFWVDQPEKSVILEITSDIRSIKSEWFATPYSLRFPRAHKVRYDKPWYDCLDVDTLVQMVHSRTGNAGEAKDREKQISRPRAAKPKKVAKAAPVVLSHMLGTDVSQVKQETSIFKGLVLHFINVQPQSARDHFHKLVVQNGGLFAMNLSASVTHVIAAEKKGMWYKAAALKRDVIHQSWVLDCCAEKLLVPLRPKYILHLMKDSKIKLQDDVDEFGDNHYEDLDAVDLQQLFKNMERIKFTVSKADICKFETKHFKREGYGEFCGCCMYFHSPDHIRDTETRMVGEVTLKRLELGVSIRKGEVASKAKNASHMIVYSPDNYPVSFKETIEAMASDDRKFAKSRKLHVVRHTWLEDALAKKEKPTEDLYTLKDMGEQEDVEMLEEMSAQEECPVLAMKSRKRGGSCIITPPDSEPEVSEGSSKRRLFDKASDAGLARDSYSKSNMSVAGKVGLSKRGCKSTKNTGGKRVSVQTSAPKEKVREPRVAEKPFSHDLNQEAASAKEKRIHSKNSRVKSEHDGGLAEGSPGFQGKDEEEEHSRGNATGSLDFQETEEDKKHVRENGICLSSIMHELIDKEMPDVVSSRPCREAGVGREGVASNRAAAEPVTVGSTSNTADRNTPASRGTNGQAAMSGVVEGTVSPGPKKKVSYRDLVHKLFEP